MNSDTKKRIGRIAAGMIFLLNPNITVVDILPDFIGCILVISGLSRMRDISDSLEAARSNFLRLFWVSLSHIPAFMLMVIISASFVNEKTSILVFSFVYAVIEFILINNALTSLIDGMVYVGERYDGDCCFYEVTRKARIDVSHLRLFTTVFLVVTKGLSVAPNLVYLYDTSLGYGTVVGQYAINPVSFIGPITVICFIPGIIFGIVWAFRMNRYLCTIRRDDAFCSVVDDVLSNSAIQNTAVYKYRRTCTAIYILIAAFVLFADFYIDEFNIVPDLLSAVLMLSAAIYMKKKFASASGSAVAVSAVYTAAQTLMLVLCVYFNSEFKFSDVGRVLEADAAFELYIGVLCVCEVLSAITTALLFGSYSRVLADGFSSAVRQGHTRDGKDIFFESHKKKCMLAAALSLVAGICHIVQIFSMGDMKRILLNKNSYTDASGIYVPSLEGFWMVSFLSNVVFIAFAVYTITRSRDELKDRLYIL